MIKYLIGLIENKVERNLTQCAALNESLTDSEETATEHVEQQEASAVSDCENTFEEVGKHYEGQDNADFSDDFDSENE